MAGPLCHHPVQGDGMALMLIDDRTPEPDPDEGWSLPILPWRTLARLALALALVLVSAAVGGWAGYLILLGAVILAARTADRALGEWPSAPGLSEHRQ